MSYLLTQLFLYLLVAFLLGLILGWLIWRYGKTSTGDYDALKTERDALMGERNDLRTNLDACRTRSAKDRETVEALRADKVALQNRVETMTVAQEAALIATPTASVETQTPVVQGTKPEGLSGPRGGQPDDLQQIKGVGPKLEQLLFDLGYYHFDQIGQWSASEVAWVDDNLEGFKGRVSRDNWITQARKLAQG